jgi:hypothetical protein
LVRYSVRFDSTEAEALQAFHRGLNALQSLKHFHAGFFGGRIFGVVEQSRHLFQERGGAFLEAADLLFPGEFFIGAFEQVGEKGDVFAGGPLGWILGVDGREFGLEIVNRLSGALDLACEIVEFDEQLLLPDRTLLSLLYLFERGHSRISGVSDRA